MLHDRTSLMKEFLDPSQLAPSNQDRLGSAPQDPPSEVPGIPYNRPIKESNSWGFHGASEIWEAAYRLLEQSIVSNQLLAWIQPLKPLALESETSSTGGHKIILGAPNDFTAQWVRDHYSKTIESALAQVSGAPCEISFEIQHVAADHYSSEAPAPVQENPKRPAAHSDLKPGTVIQTGSRPHQVPNTDIPLDLRYTFDSFVVGASNQFAYAAAVAVAEQPARQYNPLFIYSQPGLGKTHLLHAIGNHFCSKNPGARIAYLSAEKFVNELIESLQHNRMPQFRTKYRDSFDMILIDDIQFIAGKAKTEEEFFHTFNALHATKRQIVLTSDRPPKEIAGLEERIRTRFEWGLISDITPPEIETRIAILKAKAERDDIYLPDDVATFMATHIKSNVRELEGILIRLQAQASLTGAEISLEMAKQELRSIVPDEDTQFTAEAIQSAVAKYFNLKPQDFRSNTRTRQIALPRQIAMFLVRKYTAMGFKEIGIYFGGKDHTTILHAYRKIEAALETDSEIQSAVEAIQNRL